GCIAVTLARELGTAQMIASDISPAALGVAKQNAARHGLAIECLAYDLLDAFSQHPIADFITCNPPYVGEHEMPTLQREVRDWEPRVALTDSSNGLSFYRRIFNDAALRLKSGGYLLCEMGYTQSETIYAMVDHDRWEELRFLDDLQGIPRTIVLRRR